MMDTDSMRYQILKVLAEAGEPLTCKEIYPKLDDQYLPKSRDAGGLTPHTSQLFNEHHADRRRREEAMGSPYEYWPAAKGRRVLEKRDHLPNDAEITSPDGDADDDAELIPADEGGVEIESTEQLNAILTGMGRTLNSLKQDMQEVEQQAGESENIEELRESARQAQGAADRLQDRLDTLRVTGDGPFGRAERDLQDLADNGYGLYNYEYEMSFGGDVVELHVKAKPASDCSQRIELASMKHLDDDD